MFVFSVHYLFKHSDHGYFDHFCVLYSREGCAHMHVIHMCVCYCMCTSVWGTEANVGGLPHSLFMLSFFVCVLRQDLSLNLGLTYLTRLAGLVSTSDLPGSLISSGVTMHSTMPSFISAFGV